MSDKATYIIDLKDAFSPKLKNASQSLDKFEGQMKRVSGSNGSGGLLGEFGAAFSRAMAPLAIAAGVVMFTGKLITLGAELEKTRVQIDVLVGDAERANQLFGDMVNMALVTPFGTKDIVDGAKTMLAFGIEVDKIMPSLAMIGDVAMGDAQKMGQLTLAFSQMTATGRLMGQDLLQMINAGFNPLKEISKATGIELGVLKEAMEKGAISADMVKEAFVRATSEGGLFFEMMEKQSKTVSGQWAAFTGEVQHALAELGEKSAPATIRVIQGLRDGFSLLTRVDFSPIIYSFREIGTALSEVGNIFSELFEAMGFATDGMTTMQLAFQGVAFSIRMGLTPLRLLLEGFKLLVMVGESVWDVLRGVGLTIIGIFNRNLDLIELGMNKVVDSTKTGLNEIFNEISNFGKKEAEGWGNVFSMGDPAAEKEKQAGLQRFDKNEGAFDSLKGLIGADGKVGGRGSKLDGEVRSGGVKNVNININQLVGEVNFERFDNMNETKVVEIVKRALLTAVNDANVAIQ